MATQTKPGSLASPNDREDGIFSASILDEHFHAKAVEFSDRKVTGAQVAEAAGVHRPLDYVVLQHLKSGELESLRPTEIVDLAEKGIERFFVIEGSEVYRFSVEGLAMEWPVADIPVPHVKMLARIEPEAILVLLTPEGERVLNNDEHLNLKAAGAEELRIRKKPKLIDVVYNYDQHFGLEPRKYSTEELMDIFKVQAGYKLDVIDQDGCFRELAPDEKVLIVEGIEFVSHPPRGESS